MGQTRGERWPWTRSIAGVAWSTGGKVVCRPCAPTSSDAAGYIGGAPTPCLDRDLLRGRCLVCGRTMGRLIPF